MHIPSQGSIVLLIEDEPDSLGLMQTYLEDMGMSVIQTSNGRAALGHLIQVRPALVCLDLLLPELSGYELCEFMRKSVTLRQVPILVVSARGLPEDRAWAAELGATAYLVKPFSQKAFVAQVKALLKPNPEASPGLFPLP